MMDRDGKSRIRGDHDGVAPLDPPVHVVPFKPAGRQTAARPVLPPEVFAAVRGMWTAVLVRDYLTRHATDGVDTSLAPLYNASIASGGGHGEDGPASGEAKAAHQSEDHR